MAARPLRGNFAESFADTTGWGVFNFGHHAPPYAEKAAAAPNDSCAFCDTANATDDTVFTTFYPILERPWSSGEGAALSEPDRTIADTFNPTQEIPSWTRVSSPGPCTLFSTIR